MHKNIFTTLLVLTLVISACGSPLFPSGPEAAAPEVPAEVPETVDEQPEAAAPQSQGCPPARELGPWAPNNGLGEDFEVTANELVSAGVHVQLWWPAGSGQPWGTEEISVLVPSGLSVEVQDGAGRGWEYAKECPASEIEAQISADNARRQTDTAYYGRVDIDNLISTGLVVVRFDRRSGAAANPTQVAVADGSDATCDASRAGDSDGMATITASANETLSVETWGGNLGDAFVVVPAGKSVDRTWQGGAIWAYPCADTAAVLADVSNRGKTVYLVTDGALVKQ